MVSVQYSWHIENGYHLDKRVKNNGKRLLPAWMLGATLVNPRKKLKLRGIQSSLPACLDVAGSVGTKTDNQSSNPDETSSSPQVEGLGRGSMLARKKSVLNQQRGRVATCSGWHGQRLTNLVQLQGKLKVRGGSRGEGLEIMCVQDILVMFKKIQQKNRKVYRNYSGCGSPIKRSKHKLGQSYAKLISSWVR